MSSIPWCDRSDWNPIRGCSRADEGCRHCYAESMAARFSDPGGWGHGYATRTPKGPRWTGKVELVEERLTLPLKWRKPARVFVNSASDLFHEKVKDEWLDRINGVIALCPHLDFLVLTKRSARAREYYSDRYCERRVAARVAWSARKYGWQTRHDDAGVTIGFDYACWPLPNLWLGTSIHDQASANERIPELLATPAALRFVSYEPALGPVNFTPWIGTYQKTSLDWLIVGGESGPGARPFYLAWARDAVGQCRRTATPIFVKQMGAYPSETGRRIKLRDRKGEEPAEWPAELRVREFPRSVLDTPEE